MCTVASGEEMMHGRSISSNYSYDMLPTNSSTRVTCVKNALPLYQKNDVLGLSLSQTFSTLTKFIKKIINIYDIKCRGIDYKTRSHDESIDIYFIS
jgi:hypothetical protein